MIFRRSTRDIVIPRRRQREMAAAKEQEKTGTEPLGEAVPGETTEGGIVMSIDKTKLLKDLRDRWVIWAVVGAALLIVLVLLLLPKEAKVKQVGVPEGKTVIAVESSAALAGQVDAGDVVRLYDITGAVIPELQYVQVLGKSAEGELLLAMDDIQATAFVSRHGGAVSIVSKDDPEAAAELLDLQHRIIYPKISVTMNRTATLAPGEVNDLGLRIKSDPEEAIMPEITWTTTDAEVASVEGGIVTPGKVGQATITVSCGDVSASCELTVRVPLTVITLSQTEATMGVGTTLTLTATPDPVDATYFAATWTVDNTGVATVAQDGTVTAVAAGTATVTATCGEISASCVVTVKVETEVIQLSEHALTIPPEGTAQLTVSIYPADSLSGAAVWTSDNEAVVKVDENGLVTAVNYGTATVTVKCGERTDSCVVTVKKG